MRRTHMTRRTFVEAAALVGGGAFLAGLYGCAKDDDASSDGSTGRDTKTDEAQGQAPGSQDTNLRHAGDGPQVFFAHNIDSAAIQMAYAALGRSLEGSNIAVKLSTGEPGSNYLRADLIARIESLDGEHVLEAAEKLGVGSRAYELVEIG